MRTRTKKKLKSFDVFVAEMLWECRVTPRDDDSLWRFAWHPYDGSPVVIVYPSEQRVAVSPKEPHPYLSAIQSVEQFLAHLRDEELKRIAASN